MLESIYGVSIGFEPTNQETKTEKIVIIQSVLYAITQLMWLLGLSCTPLTYLNGKRDLAYLQLVVSLSAHDNMLTIRNYHL